MIIIIIIIIIIMGFVWESLQWMAGKGHGWWVTLYKSVV